VRRLPERGVLVVATTTTLPRCSGRGTAPTAPAADVTGTGGAAAADTITVGAAAATVNTLSWCSGRNTIAVSDAAAQRRDDGGSICVTRKAAAAGAILDDNTISTKKTTSNKNQQKFNPIQGPTGGAAKKDSQSSPRRIAAATSLVNLTVGCGETERNVDNLLPAIDKAIHEMFPPLRDTLADDIEVVEFAMKEPPLLFPEGVAAARQSSGSDVDNDNEFDEVDSGKNNSGHKVGGAMSTNMEARLILKRFWSKQASLTSPSLFAKTTGDKGSFFSTSDEDNDYIPEEEPTAEGLYDDDELFQDDKEKDLEDLSYYRSDAKFGVGRKLNAG